MSLHFQSEDDVDRAAKEERHTPALVFVLLLFAAVHGGYAWFRDESLASYAKDLAWLVGFGLVYWIVAPSTMNSDSVQKRSTAKCPRLKSP
jgi:hypothetical protein